MEQGVRKTCIRGLALTQKAPAKMCRS
jgi:hypothetical protein